MEFFAIIIVLAILQLRKGSTPLHFDGWFFRWVARLRQAGLLSVSPLANVLVVAGLPALLAAIIVALTSTRLLGLPELLVLVVGLLYSMGRGSLTESVADYLASWRRGDVQGAFEKLGRMQPEESMQALSSESLHNLARSALLYRGFERFFAVLFWFCLLGPAASIFYRLTFLYAHQALSDGDPQRPRIFIILHGLEWLPVRLLAASLCVFGDVRGGGRVLLSQLLHSVSSRDLLSETVVATLSEADTADLGQPPLFRLRAEAELLAVQTMLSRAGLIWVLVLSILLLIW